MEREIKFNAWIPALKYMLEDVSIGHGTIGFPSDDEDFRKFLKDNGHDSETDSENYDLPSWLYDTGEDWFQITDERQFVLLQYTGLKDKNDAEIYEEDIVECSHWEPSKYRIRFIEGAFCLCDLKTGEWVADVTNLEDSTGKHFSRVGTFYQNQELL